MGRKLFRDQSFESLKNRCRGAGNVGENKFMTLKLPRDQALSYGMYIIR